MIKAHEVQGVLALLNSFNRVGLVKVASTAAVSKLLYISMYPLPPLPTLTTSLTTGFSAGCHASRPPTPSLKRG
jgi:hypothetical protein